MFFRIINLNYIYIIFIFSFVLSNLAKANNDACLIAATTKTSENISTLFGEDTWQVQLAVAEILSKYSTPKNSKNVGTNHSPIKINPEIDILLNAIVSGKLTDKQIGLIEGYKPLLNDIVAKSVLINRMKLDNIRKDQILATSVAEMFVPTQSVNSQTKSPIAKLFTKLNPAYYFSKEMQDQEKFGPLVEFLHANQMAMALESFSADVRYDALVYMLKPVKFLSPLEVLRLIIEIPKKDQLTAFSFLAPKMVGRFDFFSANLLMEAKSNLDPNLFLKIISESGTAGNSATNWKFNQIMTLLKDLPGISPIDFMKTFKLVYSPTEVRGYLDTQSNISLEDAQLLLALLVANAHDTIEAKQYYTEVSTKLYNATDKVTLESSFNRFSKSDSRTRSKSDFESNDTTENLYGKVTRKEFDRLTKDFPKKVFVLALQNRIKHLRLNTPSEYFNELQNNNITELKLQINYTEAKIQINTDSWYMLNRERITWQPIIDDFLALEPAPTEKDLRIFLYILGKYGGDIEFFNTSMDYGLIKSPKLFLDMLKPQDFGESYLRTLNDKDNYIFQVKNIFKGTTSDRNKNLFNLWEKNIDFFIDLQPTNKEFILAKSILYGISPTNSGHLISKLIDAEISQRQLKTQKEIEKVIDQGWENSNPTDRQSLKDKYYKRLIEHKYSESSG